MHGFNTRTMVAAALNLTILCGRGFADDVSGTIIDRLQCPTVPFDISEILSGPELPPISTHLPSAIVAKDANLSATFGINNQVMFPGFRAKPVPCIPTVARDSTAGPAQHDSSRHSTPLTPQNPKPQPLDASPSEFDSPSVADFSPQHPVLLDAAIPGDPFHKHDETVWELLGDFTRYLQAKEQNKSEGVRQQVNPSHRDRYLPFCEFVLSQLKNGQIQTKFADKPLEHRLKCFAEEPVQR